MELVNGYPCFNCTDVDLAKKGINPAKPQADPRSVNYNPDAPGAKRSGFADDAVTFGGALKALNSAQSSGQTGSGLGGFDAGDKRPGSSLNISV